MKIFDRITFEQRIMLAVVIPMLIAITVIFPYFLYERISSIYSNLDESGTRLSQHVASISKHALSYGDKTYLNEVASSMINDIKELEKIKIIDEDGEIFFGPISKPEKQQNYPYRKFRFPVELTIYPINSYDIDDEISFDNTPANQSKTQNTKKATLGHVELYISTAKAIEERNKIITVYVFLTIIAVIIGYALVRSLSSSVVNPIKKVIKTVYKLRKGQYKERVKLGSKDELGNLGNNINRLAEYLEKTRERRLSQIEKLSKAQKAATDANRAKSEFMASMSHELRHPLTAIIGFLPTLKRINNDEHAKELLEIINIQANKLCRRIDEILQFEQIELKKIKSIKTYFDIETEIKSIINWHTEKARSKNIALSYHIECDDGLDNIEIHTDQIHFQTIFDNLVGNALKFTEQGSIYVYASLSRTGTSNLLMTIEIRDTGIGISKEHLDYIFEPFEQLDQSSSRQFQGIGLGLHITKRIVDFLNGTIEVDSEPQKGSIFTVKLPFDFRYSSAVKAPNKNDATIQLPKNTILYIEDDSTIQTVVKYLLEPNNIHVDICDNAAEGLALFRKHAYPVVIIDLHMPGMDGFELATEIRQYEARLQAPAQRATLIALTADVTNEATEKCFKVGFDNLLHKPFEEEQLLNAIRASLEIDSQIKKLKSHREKNN